MRKKRSIIQEAMSVHFLACRSLNANSVLPQNLGLTA